MKIKRTTQSFIQDLQEKFGEFNGYQLLRIKYDEDCVTIIQTMLGT